MKTRVDKRKAKCSVKFSTVEINIIRGIIGDYLIDHNLNLKDIAPHLNRNHYFTDHGKNRFPKNLSKLLFEALPYRTHESILQKAKYMVSEHLSFNNKTVSEQLSADIKRLLLIYGNKLPQISNLLGIRQYDLDHFVRNCRYPCKLGKFSEKEDEKLIKVIRQITNMPTEPMSEIPLKGLQWLKITGLMNNRRKPNIYRVS
jgi:hypothetical protein